MQIREYQHFIDGEWTGGKSGGIIESVDPSAEEVFAVVPRGVEAGVDQAVAATREAFARRWRNTRPKDRAQLLFELARALRERADCFAELETLDSGKPLARSHNEVLSTARYFEFYAGAADKFYGETIPLGPNCVDFTLRKPLGVTAHIVPCNFPLNMIGRSAAPALAMGNTVVIKPAEQTPITALELARLTREVGFPPGVFNVVTGYGDEAGPPLSRHPDIDSLTFTGSVENGRLVMKAAAEHIKPLVLELGGKSPHIVFADADLDLAVGEVAKGIYANSGQVCSAGSRLLVESGVRDQLLARLVEHARSLRLCPGMENPDLGPLISQEQFERVSGYVESGQQEGAALLTGGSRPEGFSRGYFMAPTIFDRVDPDMRIAQDEIFGPVLAVLAFEDEAQALEIANRVRYGLVAGIFTNDISRALRLARDLQAGQVYVNEYFAGGEETPFGGYKQSGFGREKGLAALQNYTQIKNVAIRIR